MKKIYTQKVRNQYVNLGMIPVSQEDEDNLNSFKDNQILENKTSGTRKARSLAQLNTYWACCGVVAEMVSDHENILDKDDVDFETKIQVAKKKPALIKRFKVVNGIYHMAYISIAIDNMKHLVACKFFDVAFKVLGNMVGMTEDELIALAKSKMKKFFMGI